MCWGWGGTGAYLDVLELNIMKTKNENVEL